MVHQHIAAILAILSVGLLGCGDDNDAPEPGTGDQPGAVPIEGVDLSGTYAFDEFRCTDASGDQAAVAEITGFTETVVIQGNTFTETTSAPNCTATTNGRIVFRPDGTFLFSNGTASVPNGSCSVNADLIVTADGETAVLPLDFNFVNGQSSDPVAGKYERDASTRRLGVTPLAPVSIGEDLTCVAFYVPQ